MCGIGNDEMSVKGRKYVSDMAFEIWDNKDSFAVVCQVLNTKCQP